MKNFLRPTISKITFTTLLILINFIGPIIYDRTLIFTENGPVLPNSLLGMFANALNSIGTIIFYPIYFINSFFITKTFTQNLIYNNSQISMIFIVLFAVLLPVIIEAYLLSCAVFYIISFFITKK